MRSELLIGPNLTISHDAGREVTSLLPHAPGVSRVGNRRTPPITSRRGPREHCGLVCSHPTHTRFPWARQLTHRGGDTAADGLRRPSPISWIMGVMHRSPVRSNLYSVSPMSQQGKSRACPGGAVRQSNPRFSTPGPLIPTAPGGGAMPHRRSTVTVRGRSRYWCNQEVTDSRAPA